MRLFREFYSAEIEKWIIVFETLLDFSAYQGKKPEIITYLSMKLFVYNTGDYLLEVYRLRRSTELAVRQVVYTNDGTSNTIDQKIVLNGHKY